MQVYDRTKSGELPTNWQVKKLGGISDIIVPMRDKPKMFGGVIPWIRIEDLDGKFVSGSKSNQMVSEETIKQMNLKPYPIGTVLCSCSGNMGNLRYYKISTCIKSNLCRYSSI